VLLLVDYSSLLYRAFFSMSADVPAHAVHGFMNMLARVVSDRKPSRLAIAVDEDWRPAFRVEAIPAYKTNRVAEEGEEDEVAPQEMIGRHVLASMGIAVVGALGFEADDVIATLATREPGPIEILSGDRDLFALVRDPDVHVLYPARGTRELEVVDEAAVTRRYGIPGRAYGDFALLRGDPSDGLPGVRGIGEKTAAALIAEHGSLDALLAATTLAPAVARKLEAGRAYLAAARRVVLPVLDVRLDPCELALPASAADRAALDALVEEWQLGRAVERLERAIAAARAAHGG
jgi:5'-3' exonuclease